MSVNCFQLIWRIKYEMTLTNKNYQDLIYIERELGPYYYYL